jgi:hypothetical protein
MSNATLATSFLSSYLRTKKQRQEKEEADQEKKARLKLFELQLAREQRAADQDKQAADAVAQQRKTQQDFFSQAKNRFAGVATSPLPGTGVQLGDVDATMASGKPPASLAELLSDPQMALQALQAGIPLPQQQEVPTEIQILRDPSLLAAKKGLAGAGAARTFMTNDMRQESAESQTVGKGFGEQYMEVQKAGMSAPYKIGRYRRMEQLMTGVDTGKLTPALTEIQALGESLGVKVGDSLGPKQALQALGNEVALQLRNPAGGAGMPGQLSDKDREFLMSMTPGLAKTPEGNRLIIKTAIKMSEREQEVAKLARAYRLKRGTIDEGFYEELAAFSEANPLFGDLSVMGTEDVSGLSDEELLQKLLGPPGG